MAPLFVPTLSTLIEQKVAIIDLQDNAEEIMRLRVAHPEQSVFVVKMDVANKQGIEATYEEIMKTFGSLDIVVNVAGIFNDKDIQHTLLVNLVSDIMFVEENLIYC